MSARIWFNDGLLPVGYMVVSEPCRHALDPHVIHVIQCEICRNGDGEYCPEGLELIERQMERETR